MTSEKSAKKTARMRTNGFAPRKLPDGTIVGCRLEEFIKMWREMVRNMREKKHITPGDNKRGAGAGEGKQKRRKPKKTPGEKRQCKSPARWHLYN